MSLFPFLIAMALFLFGLWLMSIADAVIGFEALVFFGGILAAALALASVFERELVRAVMRERGLSRVHLLHPAMMYDLFWSFWATEPPGIDGRSVLAKIDPSAI